MKDLRFVLISAFCILMVVLGGMFYLFKVYEIDLSESTAQQPVICCDKDCL